MAKHKQFTVDTGVQVYLCDPQSPWPRGTNEKNNGLLLSTFPHGMNRKDVTQDQLNDVAARLNGCPRKTLGFMPPSRKLSEVLQ
jgi:IS30 family transposase